MERQQLWRTPVAGHRGHRSIGEWGGQIEMGPADSCRKGGADGRASGLGPTRAPREGDGAKWEGERRGFCHCVTGSWTTRVEVGLRE